MKKNKIKLLISILTLLFFLICGLQNAVAEETGTSTKPVMNKGKKWRIGYLEGGEYRDYKVVLKATINGLADIGWMEHLEIDIDKYSTHKDLWNFISENTKSRYIEFVPDAFYTSYFDNNLRGKTRSEVLARFNSKKDIDLVIAMGTWAGQDLANNEHSVPTIVTSCSDPIKSKIIKSAEDSGYDHVHARVNPDRYPNQVRLFHQIVGFKKLGLVYEDSVEGKSFASVEDIEKLSKELNFEIIRCFALFNNVSAKEADDAVVRCYEALAPKIDAAYITVHRGVNLKNLPRIMKPLNQHKVYTYSMTGSEEVEHGVLMSIAMAGYKTSGLFYAETMAKIFNGAKPRELEQKLVDPPKIAINLKTAELIGYEPDFDVLAASDEIYQEIKTAR